MNPRKNGPIEDCVKLWIELMTPLRVRNADHLEQGYRTIPARFLAQVLMDVQHFRKLVTHFKDRVQRSLRLLKDHGDAVSPDALEHRFIGLQQIGILKTHPP